MFGKALYNVILLSTCMSLYLLGLTDVKRVCAESEWKNEIYKLNYMQFILDINVFCFT